MRLTLILPLLALLGGCASQSLNTPDPIGISKRINGLQASPCDCGGIESDEEHDRRQEGKERSARDGTINTDIAQGPY